MRVFLLPLLVMLTAAASVCLQRGYEPWMLRVGAVCTACVVGIAVMLWFWPRA